ncbi:MAG: hypothetical protein IPF78_07845 [Flavobacteriales bacterium]|nr:hypothetical protein [Flavobacteriales bacterium]
MHFRTFIRTAALLLVLDLGLATASAQGNGDSPYSAYGFGDLLPTGQVSQALMAGTGLAITEPYSVLLGNPASYSALARPVFEAGIAFRSTRSSSSVKSASGNDANFTGFSIGVPFANGKWGLAMGLTPFSDVSYSTAREVAFDGGDVKYEYKGSGGLDRAFVGLGRTLYGQRADSVGNRGMQVSFGADFNFVFGSIEQTRDAVYDPNAGYYNTRAFTSLVLRAPTADASLLWQGDLTKKKVKDADNWRWSVGASVNLPTNFSARYTNLVTTYTVNSNIEHVRDTTANDQGVKGQVDLPVAFGLGFGVQNARWAFTAEVKQQDWSAVRVDVPGYGLPAALRSALTSAAAVRFQPAVEGNILHRAVYRMGYRHTDAPQEVRGLGLSGDAATVGISFPLNAMQTNSWVHVGGEFGKRGSTDNGLVQERYAALWVGLAFTPWRGERWFTAPKIQ